MNNWYKSFREWRQTIPDLPRPGEANIVITNDYIAVVDEIIRANRRVRTRYISDELNLSKGTVHIIFHQHCSDLDASMYGMTLLSINFRYCEQVPMFNAVCGAYLLLPFIFLFGSADITLIHCVITIASF